MPVASFSSRIRLFLRVGARSLWKPHGLSRPRRPHEALPFFGRGFRRSGDGAHGSCGPAAPTENWKHPIGPPLCPRIRTLGKKERATGSPRLQNNPTHRSGHDDDDDDASSPSTRTDFMSRVGGTGLIPRRSRRADSSLFIARTN